MLEKTERMILFWFILLGGLSCFIMGVITNTKILMIPFLFFVFIHILLLIFSYVYLFRTRYLQYKNYKKMVLKFGYDPMCFVSWLNYRREKN